MKCRSSPRGMGADVDSGGVADSEGVSDIVIGIGEIRYRRGGRTGWENGEDKQDVQKEHNSVIGEEHGWDRPSGPQVQGCCDGRVVGEVMHTDGEDRKANGRDEQVQGNGRQGREHFADCEVCSIPLTGRISWMASVES